MYIPNLRNITLRRKHNKHTLRSSGAFGTGTLADQGEDIQFTSLTEDETMRKVRHVERLSRVMTAKVVSIHEEISPAASPSRYS
jgi:hypothetical protein